MERAVSAEGLTRRHWQVLSELAAGPRSEVDLARALAPFLGPSGLASELDDLRGRGWLDRSAAGRMALTGTGRAAHERLSAEVGRMRRQVADGLTAEEYEATVAALARMVANVERALQATPAR